MVITWIFYKLARFGSRSVSFKGKRLKLLIADNFMNQSVGLMYRPSIGNDEGMIFLFGREDKWGIWMLNMKFNIDILWIDKGGRIVDIKKGAKPCSSMFSCEVFKPKKEAKYVLEVNEGISSKYKMSIGDKLAIPS